MTDKLTQFLKDGEYRLLTEENKSFLEELDRNWQLSHQEIRILIRIARDLETWDEGLLSSLWKEKDPGKRGSRNEKGKLFRQLHHEWEALKETPKDYSRFHPETVKNRTPGFLALEDERTILGDCPVASAKTRCCQLKTLDAVINCGFDCSYCSIQSFYHDDHILFHRDLKEKLASLELDPDKTWHIGTGQSSDSLMWGNKEGLLEELIAFARKNPMSYWNLKQSQTISEIC